VTSLSHLGETIETDELLDRFAMTVADKDSRYILFCDMKCFCKWERGQFVDAVKWGEIGQRLKVSSNVDTRFDASHNLALSQRDAGYPEAALPVFLRERSLDEVIDPEEFDEKQQGEQYGNIGRCLQFMGQFDSAIVCYQKSAIFIERDPRSEYLMNQGFIRRWIAEGLITRNENKLAGIFLEAARLKWEQVAPPRAAQIGLLQVRMQNTIPYPTSLSVSPRWPQVGRYGCPTQCPIDQIKRPQQLAATEGVLLNTQDVADILNVKIPTVNEAGVGSSPTAPATLRTGCFCDWR
jgi:hypothetical protein